jgi:type IV pilus assembly protein PilE
MKTLHKKQFPGFTLIELMIVLVIVAILLAIAYPSYVNYTRKAKRGEAQTSLMNWSINQEIWRSNHPSYEDDGGTDLPEPTHPDGLYGFTAWQTVGTVADCTSAGGSPDALTYWLLAAGSGDQVNDKARDGTSCRSLCLASTGQKEPAVCWN